MVSVSLSKSSSFFNLLNRIELKQIGMKINTPIAATYNKIFSTLWCINRSIIHTDLVIFELLVLIEDI